MQLLQKLSITAVGKREKLMRVIKNPVTQYLPASSHKIGGYLVLCKCFTCYVLLISKMVSVLQVYLIVQKNWLSYETM